MKNKNRILKEGWNYIKESKNFILFTIFLFSIGILLALFFNVPNSLEEIIRKMLEEIAESTKNLSSTGLTVYIFYNNIKVAFLGILLGIFLGIIPFSITLVNGYVLGYVCKMVIREEGVLSLWQLLPHGIFELPAIIISLGLGMRLAGGLFSKNPDKEIGRRLRLSAKAFVIVLALLFIAAVIEGTLIAMIK